MKIYLTRHGQTNLNKAHLMQGRTDEPLNNIGKKQAREARKFIEDVSFDAVYSSPLIRARQTASIMADIPMSQVIKDDRIIETDFGDYELCPYGKMGPAMTMYWLLPEIFPCPESVETIAEMIDRSHGFLREIEKMDYENVLVVCHGGILRTMCGYLMDKRNGFHWRAKPTNCEIRVFDSYDGRHEYLGNYKIDK